MFHTEFRLDCFEEIQSFARKFLEAYDGDEVYAIKPVILPQELQEKFNRELNSYELPIVASSLAFKRRNCFISEETGITKYIHVDTTADQEVTHTSMILPVDGCEDTYMCYFDGKYTRTYTMTVNNTVNTMKTTWTDGPHFIGKICIDKNPTIARVDLPHDAISRPDGSYRSVITFRLRGNPTFEEVFQKLEKYDRIIK